MKLSKLYTNQPIFFKPIEFNFGVNVICAEIRLSEHTDKDTHNLGKSTVGALINFCLLKQIDKEHFLKSQNQFKEFIFFLEIQLLDKSYLTIRRSIQNNTRISFKKHNDRLQDFSSLNKDNWDHYDIPFKKSINLLDSFLNLTTISPFHFRKILGYLLRSQEQYQDVFNLNFQAKHSEWKPVLAKCLGLDNHLIEKSYDLEKDFQILNAEKKQIENSQSHKDLGEIEGILALKRNDLKIKNEELDNLDFSNTDLAMANQLAKDIDKKIQNINNEIYYLKANIQRIENSLVDTKIHFDMSETEKLFKEAKVVFDNQLKKNYNQLVDFHKTIINERRQYLLEEKNELEKDLDSHVKSLHELNTQRSSTLKTYQSTDILDRYKTLVQDVSNLKSHINMLKEQSKTLHDSQDIQSKIQTVKTSLDDVQERITKNLYENLDSNSISVFAETRINFSKIIEQVLSEPAVLNISLNSENHLEFRAKFLNSSGDNTSADKGNTYKKLLCIAFDLALLQTHINNNFPHFVFHDGVFENLDDRKKINLLKVMRDLSKLGIQQIVTMIDSDTPQEFSRCVNWLDKEEIIRTLHDDGSEGRLFNMTSW
ncbi:hypothetical protein F906_01540 [Acinetobacter pseudolwoffii]|uniref:DUF2326 domain-containing protein n=1 Tax=Acinetobacter pseudolwoffii TaxID=2053287 RepID=N9M0A8_9GAMM|nr:DUF2326 domain-containing protein [Acinetobacter pseudolwoffii]ENW86485.1 hypothetical protein F906_01540 [Acinetobacter pseudolwoffii]